MDEDLKAVLGRLEQGVSRLADGQIRLEQGQSKLEQGLSRLEQGVSQLEQSVGQLEQRQSLLEQGHIRLEEGQTRLRTDMMGRLERVEDRLTSMSEDMGVTMGAASVAMQQREGDRRDLAVFIDALSLLQRKMLRLQTDVEELQRKAS